MNDKALNIQMFMKCKNNNMRNSVFINFAQDLQK